ncbi:MULTISPECIES: ATP-binding cassette domain-containing protein [Chryseobacterium]|uniref:Lipopolysaccharide export system ATP-binding protein LptB n=1 Tax=Chryseobacterium taihuense TaxID=1141221 RepID=A0A4U8WQN8_9FLAO|nr:MULTISPECIES: ATP-binding cassette domain-containing protein [Chryseobacterium]QQV01493.1 ATP-binding cassette domain-containing protein [Chryseobacterium sp. FDAARGOS 1104]VFB05318.1 Lipopolysaccharide export system ATP-binding protein LptB [Chryseobacterium taihuense]
MSILHIDSITKSYGEKYILRDIYLSCETGKTIGILGRNGCGKSTLLQIIFGTAKGNSQYIKYNHQILQKQSDRKNIIAYLPQNTFLPKNINIKKLITLFCSHQNTEKLFQNPLMQPFLDETPKNLSGGEVRIIEILLLLYSDAEFILLDEPFQNLSPKIISEIKTMIRQQTQNKGFIISDHQYQDVIDIADDLYLLSEGCLRPVKDLSDLKQFNYLPKNI